MEDKQREEKLQGGEIDLARVAAKSDKPAGRLYRWLDNFWYHHKWATIGTAFVLIVVLVCVLQMCQRENEDIVVLCAGPYGFATETEAAKLQQLQLFLATKLPSDFDSDGEKKVKVKTFTVYSEEEIKALATKENEGAAADPAVMSSFANSNEYESYHSYTMTGNSAVMFLSPWLYEEMLAKNGALVDLCTTLGYTPEGALATTDNAGKTVAYGVRLGDTSLYRDNMVMQALPADTVVCVTGQYFLTSGQNEAQYAFAVEFAKNLLK